MSSNNQNYYDNKGFQRDADNEYQGSIDVEPAPRQFLPRIITGSEFGGQKHKGGSPPPAGFNVGGDLVGSPQSPRFQPKSEKSGEPGQIATISQNVDAAETGSQDGGAGDERDTWDNPIEFLMSCISMSVGLGNVWRFPGAAVQNGGGAFLIPYIIVLLVIGRPLYYLEMCIGQFSRYGQVKVWNAVPMMKGVGYGSITAVICVVTYYVSLMATTIYFFFASFAKDVPWSVCHEDKKPDNETCAGNEDKYSDWYYKYTVHPQRPNIDDGLGKLHWQLVLCLIFSWLLIFGSLARGVKSSGKVAYFTAIFPYVVLLILLIRGCTLEGAWDGIKEFLTPQWGEILKPKVWYAAVEQCFFSLSTAFGPVIMFSSYNSFKQDIYRDVAIISFMDTFTSLIAGITIFAVIGNIMHNTGQKFEDMTIGGPGLTFVLYPQAISSFDWVPQLFAVLFFLMLFTLGIGSATSLAGGVITIICDQFPKWKRWVVTLVVCVCGCLIGLMYVSEGGGMMLDLVDHYGSGFVIYVIGILETVGISYLYGLSNICEDIEFMLGRRPGIYWRACWGFIIPVGLGANLIYYLATEEEYTSSGVKYPTIATVCGWLIVAFALSQIIIWGMHAIWTRKASSLSEKFKLALKPTHRWGPQKPQLRKEWQDYRAEKLANRKSFFREFLRF